VGVKISIEKKESLLKKIAQEPNISLKRLSKESQVGYTTLVGWRQEMQKAGGLPENRVVLVTNAENWSSNEKFLVVVTTVGMNEHEKNEYCRSKGLYAEQVEVWTKACRQANGSSTQMASEFREELKAEVIKSKAFERELGRKEKALAEIAALLVLRKKAHAIWGENEGD
jgi:transposase-like protein